MASTKKTESRCPTCKKLASEPKAYPFCTERCRLVDLSRWLNEDYRLSD